MANLDYTKYNLAMPDVFTSNDPVTPEVEPVIPEKTPVTEKQKSMVPGHSHNIFSAFSLYPDDVDFETRENKERIVLLLRQHPLVNLKWILMTALLLTGPTIISMFGIFSFLPSGFGLIISLAWYAVTSAYAIEGFLNWYFNVYFITEKRVVDVDFYNLINKRVSSAEIEKIQDVSYATGGVARTMFNYGDIIIQTASEIPEFVFEAVPNPEKATKVLDDLRMREGV